LDIDSGDGLPRQIAELGFAKRNPALLGEVVPVAFPDEKIGLETIIFDEKSSSGFKASVELNDRAVPLNPICGLEDDASLHRLDPSREEVGVSKHRGRGAIG